MSDQQKDCTHPGERPAMTEWVADGARFVRIERCRMCGSLLLAYGAEVQSGLVRSTGPAITMAP